MRPTYPGLAAWGVPIARGAWDAGGPRAVEDKGLRGAVGRDASAKGGRVCVRVARCHRLSRDRYERQQDNAASSLDAMVVRSER
jgi:hypothetical protein